MRIAILGAGFTGLAAGLKLAKQNLKPTIFEKEPWPAGLASGFRKPNWAWPVEQAYHHLFTSDWQARKMLAEIGMGRKLFFKRPITASLYKTIDQEPLTIDKIGESKNKNRSNVKCQMSNVNIFQLDSPLSLLSFPLLPLADRLRTGLVLAYLKAIPFWSNFEKITARQWLSNFMGEKSWQILWEPLFIGKFGSFADKVNMAWFWARVKKRSSHLGYIEGGFQAFAEGIARKIEEHGGMIHYNTSVERIFYENDRWQVYIKNPRNHARSERESKSNSSFDTCHLSFDIVLSTLPTSVFTKITLQLPQDYVKKLQSIPHLHALNLILELREPFLPPLTSTSTPGEPLWVTPGVSLSPSDKNLSGVSPRPYWLNICDPSWPFLAVVEHTNFVDPAYYGGSHLVYIGNYLLPDHQFFTKKKEELFKLFLPFLERINPSYNFKLCTLNLDLFTGPFAQPVMGINYSQICPPLTTPLTNLYLANLDSVYPWDRGTNYAIELGLKAARLITSKI